LLCLAARSAAVRCSVLASTPCFPTLSAS
jgi:hypothetical protein